METYEIIKEVEHGKQLYFVLRNGATASGPHATPETAWNSAEAKAKAEATKTNRQAVYTAAQTGEAKAVWLVK